MKKFCPLLILLSTVVLGCSKAPDLVGTWHSGLGGADSTYHFRKDGTYMLEIMYDGMHAISNGKYHIEGKQLFLDPTDFNFDNPANNPLADQYKSKMMEGARVTIQMYSPMSFRLGLDEPPLIVQKIRPEP